MLELPGNGGFLPLRLSVPHCSCSCHPERAVIVPGTAGTHAPNSRSKFSKVRSWTGQTDTDIYRYMYTDRRDRTHYHAAWLGERVGQTTSRRLRCLDSAPSAPKWPYDHNRPIYGLHARSRQTERRTERQIELGENINSVTIRLTNASCAKSVTRLPGPTMHQIDGFSAGIDYQFDCQWRW